MRCCCYLECCFCSEKVCISCCPWTFQLSSELQCHTKTDIAVPRSTATSLYWLGETGVSWAGFCLTATISTPLHQLMWFLVRICSLVRPTIYVKDKVIKQKFFLIRAQKLEKIKRGKLITHGVSWSYYFLIKEDRSENI